MENESGEHRNNSVRRRELNGGSDRPDTEPATIEVNGHITPGSHQPYVSFDMAGVQKNMSVMDSVELASTIFQASAMAFEDAMLCEYFLHVMRMDQLLAFQHVSNFQLYRKDRIERYVAQQKQNQREGKA